MLAGVVPNWNGLAIFLRNLLDPCHLPPTMKSEDVGELCSMQSSSDWEARNRVALDHNCFSAYSQIDALPKYLPSYSRLSPPKSLFKTILPVTPTRSRFCRDLFGQPLCYQYFASTKGGGGYPTPAPVTVHRFRVTAGFNRFSDHRLEVLP